MKKLLKQLKEILKVYNAEYFYSIGITQGIGIKLQGYKCDSLMDMLFSDTSFELTMWTKDGTKFYKFEKKELQIVLTEKI